MPLMIESRIWTLTLLPAPTAWAMIPATSVLAGADPTIVTRSRSAVIATPPNPASLPAATPPPILPRMSISVSLIAMWPLPTSAPIRPSSVLRRIVMSDPAAMIAVPFGVLIEESRTVAVSMLATPGAS